MEEEKPTRWSRFKRKLIEYRRVLRVTKKPSGMEFKTIVKVSGLGMAIIGLLGFLIHMVKLIIEWMGGI